jgi:hypothetical protein
MHVNASYVGSKMGQVDFLEIKETWLRRPPRRRVGKETLELSLTADTIFYGQF